MSPHYNPSPNTYSEFFINEELLVELTNIRFNLALNQSMYNKGTTQTLDINLINELNQLRLNLETLKNKVNSINPLLINTCNLLNSMYAKVDVSSTTHVITTIKSNKI